MIIEKWKSALLGELFSTYPEYLVNSARSKVVLAANFWYMANRLYLESSTLTLFASFEVAWKLLKLFESYFSEFGLRGQLVKACLWQN